MSDKITIEEQTRWCEAKERELRRRSAKQFAELGSASSAGVIREDADRLAAILASLRRLQTFERLLVILDAADHYDTGLKVGEDYDKVMEELET